MNKYNINWNKVAPSGGWKERAYYSVYVQFSPRNIIHKSILYTGFINGPNNSPGSYSCLFNPTYEPRTENLDGLYSIAVIKELDLED